MSVIDFSSGVRRLRFFPELISETEIGFAYRSDIRYLCFITGRSPIPIRK